MVQKNLHTENAQKRQFALYYSPLSNIPLLVDSKNFLKLFFVNFAVSVIQNQGLVVEKCHNLGRDVKSELDLLTLKKF